MRSIGIALLLLPAACMAPAVNAPSLAPRAAEAIDPRIPIPDAQSSAPADAALVARLNALIAEARAGDAAFRAAADEAERLAAAAGNPQSESWVVAQQALSVAVAARQPVTKALGDIDAIGSAALAQRGGMTPANQAALVSAAAEVSEIDRRQAALVGRLQRQLGG